MVRYRSRTMTVHSRRGPSPSSHLAAVMILLLIAFVGLLALGRGTVGPNTGDSGDSGTINGTAGTNPTDGKPLSWCGGSNQPICPAVDPGWIPVASGAPGDIARAITGSGPFLSMQSRYGGQSLDLPARVHAFNAHTGREWYDDDHWIVSVRDASGRECGVFDFVYDQANARIRFSSFGHMLPQDPDSTHAFPFISSQAAVAHLASERKLSLMAGQQPELIFFPIDPRVQDPTSPVHTWTGGGEAPMDPMWLVRGSNGLDYFVGPDLHTHLAQELPISQKP